MPKLNNIPTVSHIGEDRRLVELIYDPVARTTAFAVSKAGEAPTIEADIQLPTGERLVPYGADNNLIASGCV
ncbi:MAG: hypothetical protein JWM33_3581, partial [Caulobacteraceae bacterium]|nr:hypothetical protein [Caulobacteraceae bacterium]